jgi:hypothetical protein
MLLSVRFHCCCNLSQVFCCTSGYAAANSLLRVSNDAKMAAFTMKPLPMVAPRPFASTPRPSSRMLLAAHCQALLYGDRCLGWDCSDRHREQQQQQQRRQGKAVQEGYRLQSIMPLVVCDDC